MPKFNYIQKGINRVEETKQKAVQGIPGAVSDMHRYCIYTITAKESSFKLRIAFMPFIRSVKIDLSISHTAPY